MKQKLLLATAAAAAASLLLTAASTGAQAASQTTSQTALQAPSQHPSQNLVGEWRSDVPLPNGVVPTFRFDNAGGFGFAMALAVDGTYSVHQNHLVETVTLPTVGVTHTDTATFSLSGDSLIVNESAATPSRVLHRVGARPAAASILGTWEVPVAAGSSARYSFGADSTMHVRATLGDEQGRYVVRGDTLHISNDRSFQPPMVAQFALTDSTLVLTPQNGKPPRLFHRVREQRQP